MRVEELDVRDDAAQLEVFVEIEVRDTVMSVHGGCCGEAR
jgi:hypothetical protein